MKYYAINGKFMADRMQGIVRYAREICGELDKLLAEEDLDVIMLLPKDAHDVPDYTNIKTLVIGNGTGIAWEQLDLGKWLRKNKDRTCINLCNTASLFAQPGITAIHDIMYEVHPEFYTTIRNRLSRFWHVFQYRYLTKHELAILTVSEFSKGEIEKYHPVAIGKTYVVPNGWQHVLRYKQSEDWRERYPGLKPGKYFFSMATLAKNKNGRWIIETAKKNPKETFAIAGKHYETEKLNVPDNVQFLGFISDEDACALIKHCKAFIFPSLYEGFGLPPLEALALGAKCIVSNSSSLPEVMERAAIYISPKEPAKRISGLLREPDGCKRVLAKYSWKLSASRLLNKMKGHA